MFLIFCILEQSNQDVKQVYQRLENALKEIKELRAENQAIREAKELRPDNRINKFGNASQRQNTPRSNIEVGSKDELERFPVLRKPIDLHANLSDLYSKQHEVSFCV